MRVLNSNKGQTATEYILLLAVAALIVFKFHDAVEERIRTPDHYYYCAAHVGCTNKLIAPKPNYEMMPSDYLLE